METLPFDTDLDRVAERLNRLPYAQPKLAAQWLAEGVHASHRAELKPAQRQKLLGLYAGAADTLCRAAELALMREELTLSKDAQIVASRTHRALAELLHGTLLCLAAQLQKRGWFERDQHKAELLREALRRARALLGWARQYYLPLPKSYWQDVHGLYRTAHARGWLDEGARGETPLAVYREILLLGLTDTRGLPPERIRQLRDALPALADAMRLLPLDGPLEGGRGAYLVDTLADTPPCFMAIAPRDGRAAWLRIDLLDSLAVLAAHEEALKAAPRRPDADDAALELLETLAQAWLQPQRRRHPRDAAYGEVGVVSQLAAICRHLDPADGTEPPPAPCTLGVVNQSPVGLMLRGKPEGHGLRAGDLLLINDGGSLLGLFFVRWLTLLPDSAEVECGVERVALQARAVRAMPSIARSGEPFAPALLIPGNPRQGIGERLLMGGRAFGRLREFRLVDGGTERLIRVTRLVSQSPHYQLMEFRASEDF
ncbi:hypothetical protein [Crenobacter luteus]|uniref:PilZ domain-containing protein n=1 Tax=Crenobacter luteus TaxID=1452487 RepID=A0A161SEE1_9NEIS|nr:hypothetical protein [Crenobacter luteus]KZE34863.1 hypothetical protein AVW16_05965 [Crenobacter luteus]